MSKEVKITAKRLGEIIELAVARTKAEQLAKPPGYVVTNSNVYITNTYGEDYYEPDYEPVERPAPAAAKPSGESRFAIRQGISNLFIRAEQKARELDERNPGAVEVSAKSATAALVERFEELQLRLKGDTSLELIRDAYVMMVFQLCLSADLSRIFEEDLDG